MEDKMHDLLFTPLTEKQVILHLVTFSFAFLSGGFIATALAWKRWGKK
jgi:hypothetical protein